MELSKFKRSEQEDAGKWFDFGDGCRVKLRSMNSVLFRKALEQSLRPFRAQIRRGTMDTEKEYELTCKAISEHLILDWQGVTLNKEPVPFSTKAAFEAMMKFRRFGDVLVETAADSKNFDEADAEEEGLANLKNTSPST